MQLVLVVVPTHFSITPVMKTMNTAVDQLITRPYQAYRDAALNNEKLARIKKATARDSLARQADDIADVVDRKRKLPPPYCAMRSARKTAACRRTS